jgi:hypothetical protein
MGNDDITIEELVAATFRLHISLNFNISFSQASVPAKSPDLAGFNPVGSGDPPGTKRGLDG